MAKGGRPKKELNKDELASLSSDTVGTRHTRLLRILVLIDIDKFANMTLSETWVTREEHIILKPE